LAPVVDIITDLTDPVNAASVNQQFKVLADFLAWHALPRAKGAAGTSDVNWGAEIVAWRNALAQRRFGVDHLGFPNGRIIQWDENWDLASMATAPTVDSHGPWTGRWNYRDTTSGVGGVFVAHPAAPVVASNQFPTSNLYQENGLVAGPVPLVKHVEQMLAPITIETAGTTTVSLSWDQAFNLAGAGTGTGAAETACGLLIGSTLMGSDSPFLTALPTAAAVVASDTSNNWRTYSKRVGGSADVNDAGVACNAQYVRRRFRIDVLSSGASDDATARVNWFIDGTLVKDTAVDFTNGGNGLTVIPFFRLWGEGAALGQMIGAVRFRASTFAGDVFL
jgi:hypothetical protein